MFYVIKSWNALFKGNRYKDRYFVPTLLYRRGSKLRFLDSMTVPSGPHIPPSLFKITGFRTQTVEQLFKIEV